MNRTNANPQDKVAPLAEPIARVGRIVAVTGAHAIILLDVEERANVENERSPEIGTLLKVDGLLYQVKAGEYLGQNYGKILKISETEISLREIVQDAAGEWIERPTTLQLQESGR